MYTGVKQRFCGSFYFIYRVINMHSDSLLIETWLNAIEF